MLTKDVLHRIANVEELSRNVSFLNTDGGLVGPTLYLTAPDTCWLDMEGLAAIACIKLHSPPGDNSILVNFAYKGDTERVIAEMRYRVPVQIPGKRNRIQFLEWIPLSVLS